MHTTGDPLPLPGLEDMPSDRAVGYVESGVRRTLAALVAADRLAEVDAGHLAVAIALSRIITQKEARGRLSTVSNDARLLVELLDAFTADDESAIPDDVQQIIATWKARADAADLETWPTP
jgi:hypothetical protein